MKVLKLLLAGFCLLSNNAFSQIEVNSEGDLDLNDNTLFIRNISGNTYGMGYGIYGSTYMSIFSDAIIDFRESDASTLNVRFDLNNKKFDFYGDLTFNKNHWSGGLKTGITTFNGTTMAVIYPASDWYGSLGTSTKRFGAAHIDHIYYDVLTDYSDSRIKENITEIEDVTKRMRKLRPVKYDLKENYFDSVKKDAREYLINKGKNNVGLIAEEVKEVFPELVYEDAELGLLCVNYVDLIPYLLAMLQEQQLEIEKLNKQAQGNSSKLKSGSIQEFSTTVSEVIIAENVLKQNYPNPWNSSTNVELSISQSASSAMLCIYDMTGKQLKCEVISERGETQVSIHAEELQAGMYMYSLLVDGQLIDTKTMVLTN